MQFAHLPHCCSVCAMSSTIMAVTGTPNSCRTCSTAQHSAAQNSKVKARLSKLEHVRCSTKGARYMAFLACRQIDCRQSLATAATAHRWQHCGSVAFEWFEIKPTFKAMPPDQPAGITRARLQ